ncbi:hypothetical protein SUGI_0790710 [Cryptomeria japonica]|uniref:protein kinase STUNTED n=1 Tax=Cryptomeria japonica TaxID=3369 RepID=UPI0024146A13|nr:protein kinase STUNTED [Cryptomeria japonica]GLJ38786.1 hypothetical protein SUGI_0790710 [Cryptomeria japonica]
MGCVVSSERINAEKEKEVQESSTPQDDYAYNATGTIQRDLTSRVDVDCETAMKFLHRKKKQRWRMGLCFFSHRKRLLGQTENNNNAWLLGANPEDECNGCNGLNCDAENNNEDVCSVNSSFRFSFGSQRDWEASNPGATVLLLNLEKGMESSLADAHVVKEFEWARIQSLERQISPAVEGLMRLEYEEICAATADFSQDKVLGRGAHSCVYRGRLRHGKLVAVKYLDKNDKESGKAFCRELHIASSLKNRHVVPLLGFCIDPQGLFLVYKFISGGSLEYHLHEKKGKGCLSWPDRLQVAIGIAKAVDYLHHGTHKCVVHRDIKPSNVLLSRRKTAKLCDFGLATWTLGASVPFLCKTVKGTFGYLAPEYFQHGKVSEKTDIYAFGVVLLELLTGRKPIETKKQGSDENLVLWARPLLNGGLIEELVDPRLKSRLKAKHMKQVDRMIRAAAVCLHPTESWRPCMSQVVRILQGHDDTGLLQHACLAMINVNGDCITGNEKENIKALKGHLAVAMVGVDLDADDEKPDYKLNR